MIFVASGLKRPFLLLLFFGFFWAASHATDELLNVNAGVTPYSCENGGAQYLLAYDSHPKRQGWGGFGGRPNLGETSKMTALREFYEETNCVYSIDLLNELDLKGPSLSKRFYTYIAEVPFIPSHMIEQERTCKDVERSMWVWVRHDHLMALIRPNLQPVAAQTPQIDIHLWKGAKASLDQALADQVMPTNDPCL